MGNGVNTNIEALHEIKDSLVRFQERIAPLQSELTQAFQEIDEQLSQSVKLKMRQLDKRRTNRHLRLRYLPWKNPTSHSQ